MGIGGESVHTTTNADCIRHSGLEFQETMLQPLKTTPGAEKSGHPGVFICVKTLIINHLSQIYNHHENLINLR